MPACRLFRMRLPFAVAVTAAVTLSVLPAVLPAVAGAGVLPGSGGLGLTQSSGQDWPQFHRQASQDGYDSQENLLGPGTVPLLRQKWQTSPHGPVTGSSPVVADGLVFSTPGFPLNQINPPVAAVSAATGKLAWILPVPGEPTAVVGPKSYDPTPAISGGMLYVGSVNSAFYAFSLATRKQVWSFDPPRSDGPSGQQVFTSATVAGGIVYVGATNNKYYALDAATGAELWKVSGGLRNIPPAVAGGLVFVSQNFSVLALDATTGDMLWRFKDGSAATGSEITSGPAVSGGVAYVTDNHDNVLALDANTGDQRWSASVGGTGSAPAVAKGIVYVGSANGTLYALSATTGRTLWSFHAGSGAIAPPAVANGVVYFGSGSQEKVYALNAANGRELRSFNVNDGPNAFITSSPAIAGSTVYVTAGLLDAFSLR